MESDRIKRAREALQKLVARYTDEMDKRLPMAIHAPADDVAIAGISEYDGTAGFDPRPDFVKQDDEAWLRD